MVSDARQPDEQITLMRQFATMVFNEVVKGIDALELLDIANLLVDREPEQTKFLFAVRALKEASKSLGEDELKSELNKRPAVQGLDRAVSQDYYPTD